MPTPLSEPSPPTAPSPPSTRPGRPRRLAVPTLAVAALTLLVLLAGCLGPPALDADVSAVVAEATVAPGTQAAFGVAIDGIGDEVAGPLEFEAADAAGLDVTLPDPVQVNGTNATGAWLTVAVPDGAEPGTHEVLIRVVDSGGDGVAEVTLTVEVAAADPTVEEGQTAVVHFTGRLSDGAVFATNVQAVDNASVPKDDLYRPPQGPQAFQPAPVDTRPGAGLIEGIRRLIVGTGVGHTVTETVPAHLAFGNETIRSEQPREESVDRNVTQQRVFEGRLQIFGSLINETTEEGDIVEVPFGDGHMPYEVTHLNDTHANITAFVEVGDRFTHTAAWPNATEVVEIDADANEVRLRETPTTDVGEAFTLRPEWPNATEVVEVTNATIRIRHSPEVGTTYTQQTQQGPIEVTVVELTDDAVVVEQDNPHPLAGEPLAFDITVVEVQQAPPGGGGSP